MWHSLLLASALAFGDHNYGPVEPVALPDLSVTRHDGAVLSLREAVGSRRAAVQFVFTSCQTTCPLLGSLFRGVDREAGDFALISITVDPEHDTPARLAAWRQRFHATDRWIAVQPRPADLTRLLALFGQKAPTPAAHSMQIFFIEQGRYVARTTELPRSALVADALRGRTVMAGIAPVAAPVARAAEAPAVSGSGDQLYYGERLRGRLSGELLAGTSSRCSGCHGAQREGGAEGTTRVPALTAASMTQAQSRRGGPPSRYTAESFCAVMRTGTDPAGIILSQVMPRYEISTESCQALWQFLTSEDSHQ